MRIGIFFGGQSREREISFAGGRTVYDNLDKTLFTPVPIFVDSLGNFILLDWQYLYKGTIRDFYPPASQLPPSPHFFQVYIESIAADPDKVEASIKGVGKYISPNELASHIDFAFLALHGPYGEDGNIQGLLEWYNIPYSGSGILPSSIGIDKSIQKQILKSAGFDLPKHETIKRNDWLSDAVEICDHIDTQFQFPVVIKSPHQGSSIGITIVRSADELKGAINKSFFIQTIYLGHWRGLDDTEKRNFLIQFTDIREGLGFPVLINEETCHHPEALWTILDSTNGNELTLVSPNGEEEVLVESFMEGIEFSCIVITSPEGKPLALPPTEIRKKSNLFDYRAKYLPGISRKVTPIDLPTEAIEDIRKKCELLYQNIHSQVYARIDGFYTAEKRIILNDPNTTSGMLPSSFFFHQAAEIGLNPSQFLTYIIEESLKARGSSGKQTQKLRGMISKLNESLALKAKSEAKKINIGVVMGGFSTERHISIESGRNIYEKLASSAKYHPIPIFLTGDEQNHQLFQLPINIMLKDNADDIREKVLENKSKHEILTKIADEAQDITSKFAYSEAMAVEQLSYADLKGKIDFAFIALHGRPGEDGAIQKHLEEQGIPYNGSGIESSATTIDKFKTNKILRDHGFLVADHCMIFKSEYGNDPIREIEKLEDEFGYPFIAKPSDDGCSSAVKMIRNRSEIQAFSEMMFRDQPAFPEKPKETLRLKDNEEFPMKDYFLVEELIKRTGDEHFLEITGGVITRREAGKIIYEAFEPSETLASGEVLSLEEKFLAGEGQNITPARFDKDPKRSQAVSDEVKGVLEKVAETLGVEGYCRIDAFVRVYPDKVETYIIEINSLPGMTPATAIFHQAALAGLKPYEFIDQIITYGFNK
ncbi:MAG: D-alanine--D-alanine ligase [Cyclobacteriaceae bacterium]|nr:D-alanine--D-alanine ligase [Cyclobacteriaceae bacterium SS2]